MRHLVITAICLGFCASANASEQAAKTGAGNGKRVYFIEETGSLVKIKKAQAPKEESIAETPTTSEDEDLLVMRDPNLPGSPAKVAKIKPQPAKKTASLKTAVKKKAPVSFKPLRVAGSVRMPRVEFGKVALPVGLREETPSINFIDRSLSDLP